MGKGVVIVGTVLLAFSPGSVLSAQLWPASPPGEDIASLAVFGGAFSPNTTLPDGSSHSTGAAAGAAATLWIHRFAGVRASFTHSKVDGQSDPARPFSAAGAQDPTIWLYGIDLTLRFPIQANALSLAPFINGGPGGKSYRWSIDTPRVGDSTIAWSYGGGVEVRPSRGNIGLVLQAENHRSRYLWHGLGLRPVAPDYKAHGPVLNDIVLSAGLTLNR